MFTNLIFQKKQQYHKIHIYNITMHCVLKMFGELLAEQIHAELMRRVEMFTILSLILEHTDGSGWSPAGLHPDTCLLHHDRGLLDLLVLLRRLGLHAPYLHGPSVSGLHCSTAGEQALVHPCHAQAT